MISAQPNILIRLQYGQTITHTSLSVPMGVFAVHIIKPDNTEEINYIHKDHTSTSLSTGLGSWNTITDESGNLIQELSFDACSVKPVFCESSEAKTLVEPISAEARGREGNRRDPATWRAFAGTPPEPLFDRGFTGHEHLYAFNLINMNGRVYDPIVSRMLSPDNFIQAPGFSQSLNRYSYCWNNPLKYTDPTGQELGVENRNNWFWWEYRGGSNSSHSIGPGSGNHWSDQYRGEHGDFWLMNQRSFDNKYGDGAYLRGIELNKSSNIFNSLWKSGNIGTNSKVFLVKTTWANFSITTEDLNFTGFDYTYGVEIGNSTTTNCRGSGGGIEGLDNILFAVSMGQKGGDKAVQYFQMSNKGILRAAVNNDIPTGRIKDIMRSTGKVGTGLKVVGVLGNVASAGHTMYKISQDGMSVQYGADLVFNGIAFVPGWGWIVSGVYFGGQAIMESDGFKAIQKEWHDNYPITGAPPQFIGHCFIEGTQVLMKDFSLCSIENIEVGDTVKTFNFRTYQLEDNQVLKISAPMHKDLITIRFSNDIKNINTEDHPYYIKGKGWCSFKPELTFQRYGLEALQLKQGDICYYYKDGELLEIKLVEFIPLDKEVKTYNLTEIENSNNYFANGFLIHNESESLKNTSKVPMNKNGQRVIFKPLEIKK